MSNLKDDDSVNEYRVKFSIRNNLILTAIENAGYKNVSAFCKAVGIPPTSLTNLVAMKEPPITKSGEFSHAAKKLMEELCLLPTELWTTEQLHLKLERNIAVREVSAEGMRAALGMGSEDVLQILGTDDAPDEGISKQELKDTVADILDSINPREAKILRLRFGFGCREHTLEEVAEYFDVTRERIRQIENKAIRKLKHPSRSDKLKELVRPESVELYKPSPAFQNIWEEARWHAEQERLNKEKSNE